MFHLTINTRNIMLRRKHVKRFFLYLKHYRNPQGFPIKLCSKFLIIKNTIAIVTI